MRIVWSLPVRGKTTGDNRGDLVRARSLIEALRRDGHDVLVAEDGARAGSTAMVSVFRHGVRRILPHRSSLVLRDAGRWVHGRAHGARVASLAREWRADLIVETQVAFATSGAHAAARTRLPLVVDDCSPSIEESLLGVGLASLARKTLRDETRAATRVIAVSTAARALLVHEGVAEEKLALVPNGIHDEAFSLGRRERLRRELGLGPECVIGFVGSFQPWHRLDLLMESLAESHHDFRLALVGDGPGLEPALESARSHRLHHRVVSLGEVAASRVPEIVSALDIGVLPGTNDYGHPMKLMEYAAGGIPSVAPDVPPVREVLEDGKTGLLFAPGEPAALRAALQRLLGDRTLRARLGNEARSCVVGRCSWQDRARRLLEDLV